MITAHNLAGYFAAHAIWCVSELEGEPLIPMLAFTGASGERQLQRLVSHDLAGAVATGQAQLASNEMGAADAVLVYDGRITVGEEKLDAIILELRAYVAPEARAVMAVPYTPGGAGSFLVHKPKILEWQRCEDFDLDVALQAFWQGVDSHERGGKIWSEHLDQSK